MQTLHVGMKRQSWPHTRASEMLLSEGWTGENCLFFRKKASIKTGLEVKLHDKLNVFTYGYISIYIYINIFVYCFQF